MSILDDEDVILRNTEIEIERIVIRDFLTNYCGSSRIFENAILLDLGLAKEIAVRSKYNHKSIIFEDQKQNIRQLKYNDDFFIEYTKEDGWVVYLLNNNTLIIRGKAGRIPDCIKFKSTNNKKIYCHLLNCALDNKTINRLNNEDILIVDYIAMKYLG